MKKEHRPPCEVKHFTKKLSVEEKAKRYDEAIKKLRSLYDDYDTVSTLINVKEELENIFPELKKSEDERIGDMIIKSFDYTNPWDFLNNRGVDKQSVIAWLEKQGEQKPADKVEPKFKVGDWIIFDENHNSVYQVEKIQGLRYCLRHYTGGSMSVHIDNQLIRHWTIEDAKDGDVLVHNDCTFIFVGIKDGIVQAIEENILEPVSFGEPNKDNDYHPATKEQRDLLFQKMKEAGYEWDAEKKELKKIENETEIPFGAKDSELQEATYYIPKSFRAEIGKDNIVIKKGEQNPAWSEEDEKMFKYALDMIEWYSGKNESKSRAVSDFLKSLKDRVLPQPKQEWSEEDKQIIKDMQDDYHNRLGAGIITQKYHDKIISWLKSLKKRKVKF